MGESRPAVVLQRAEIGALAGDVPRRVPADRAARRALDEIVPLRGHGAGAVRVLRATAVVEVPRHHRPAAEVAHSWRE